MPFELLPFQPQLTLLTPTESASDLTVRLASWRANATVKIRNETSNYKVGWVQVLVRNNIVATYDNQIKGGNSHRCECRVLCDPLPVKDSDPGMGPWYDDGITYSPEVQGINPGTVTVAPRMSDRPLDDFPWRCNHVASAPLLQLDYELSFRTWLVVHDIGVAPLPTRFVAVLYNFMYTITNRFVVDVTRPVGMRATRSSTASPGIERYDPPLPIPACLWRADVANDSLTDEWLLRDIVRA